MKKGLSLLFVFIFACHSTDDNTIAFLNEGIKNCNSQISQFNDKFYINVESAAIENPLKNKTYKIKVDSLKIKSKIILSSIEKLINEQRSIYYSKENPEINLTCSISEYTDLLDDFFPSDSIIKEKTKQLTTFNEYSVNNEHELNILTNKIHSLIHTALNCFAHKMQEPKYRPNKTEPIVIPKSRYVYYNEEFVANLYLVSYDSTASNITIELENIKLAILDGKASYSDSINNKPGIINKNGLIWLKEPSSDYFNKFPFIVHYQIK
jgi:hypothetical protein